MKSVRTNVTHVHVKVSWNLYWVHTETSLFNEIENIFVSGNRLFWIRIQAQIRQSIKNLID